MNNEGANCPGVGPDCNPAGRTLATAVAILTLLLPEDWLGNEPRDTIVVPLESCWHITAARNLMSSWLLDEEAVEAVDATRAVAPGNLEKKPTQ